MITAFQATRDPGKMPPPSYEKVMEGFSKPNRLRMRIQPTFDSKPAPLPEPTKEELIAQSIIDPVLFSERWLQVELWPKQAEILSDIFTYPKVSVRACHASSKTFTAAVATLAFLARYDEGIVITTAPTQKQVEKLLWVEIRNLAAQSLYPFPVPSLTQLIIPGPKKRYAIGFTTSVEHGDEGVRFQGFHARHILVILDEAPGVDGKIWEAIEGIRASGDVHVLALGNPTIASGPFFDSFGVNRSGWKTHSISAFDTPNFKGLYLKYTDPITNKLVILGDVAGQDFEKACEDEIVRGQNPTPYLITRGWVYDRLKEWGPTHPLFQSRCLGNFAAQSPDSLLSLTWLEQAKLWAPKTPYGKLSAGIDVAGPGEDETTLYIRQGSDLLFSKSWPNPDPRGEIVAVLNEFEEKYRMTVPDKKQPGRFKVVRAFSNINVDVCGIGYYLARHLEDLGFPVSDINVAEAATDPNRYANLKAEAYWGLRMRAIAGDLTGIVDDLTISQLVGIRYKTNARGQIVIESKEEAAKRGVKSPDRAEGVMLCFCPPRMHGLLSWWGQKAEELAMEGMDPRVPNTDVSALAEQQKKEADFPKASTPVKTPGKTITVAIQPDECPCCGNKFLGKFADGGWKCTPCGARGVKRQKYNEDGNLVDL